MNNLEALSTFVLFFRKSPSTSAQKPPTLLKVYINGRLFVVTVEDYLRRFGI